MEAAEGYFSDVLKQQQQVPCKGLPPPPLNVDIQNQGSDPGTDTGAASGKSETYAESRLLSDPAAAAATPVPCEHLPASVAVVDQHTEQHQPEQQQQQQEPPATPTALAAADSSNQDGGLVPLSPPDESEGPEAAAEYELYLQRWDAGDTLAQRWHRLASKDKLGDIKCDWEDWQLDIMMVDLKARTAAALAQQGKPGGCGGSLLCSTRLRRGRGEVQEPDDSPTEEPRRVRSRRAPSTLQDYHVDAAAAAANKTPEKTPDTYTPAAAAAAAGGSTYRQQQLLPAYPTPTGPDAASEDSTDDGADNATARSLQQQQQGVHTQQQQQRPAGRRGPLPQHPPKRVVTRVQRNSTPQQAAAPSHHFNRVITPYNPAQLQQQQQMQVTAQQMMQAAMQQEQQQVAAAAAMAGVSPEMLDEFYAMGSRLGAAFGQGEGGTAAGLAQNPAAMAAFMHALYQYGANPSILAQQVSSVMGQPQ